MIVALAIATHTHPDQWWETDDITLATAIDILRDAAED